jgi:mono/diheme cytochrome c family protein
MRLFFGGVLGVLVIGIAGFIAIAWWPAIPPDPTARSQNFPPALVAEGAVLAGAGYCAVCHTAAGGAPYAGGYGLATPFGVIYSANITPDPQTGIGDWSEPAFARAMHRGIARDGTQLFPAFPFDHFTKVNDADIAALYAFLMSQPPVNQAPKPNTVGFPFDIRYLQAGWKLLFLHPGVYAPDSTKSAAWNRGAYLATGLSHCGGCHTPRNALGAEEHGQEEAGAVIDGWSAPALTAANPSPLPWTADDIYTYLRSGADARHGATAGPMSPVIHVGLAKLPDADIRDITVYFADINQSANKAQSPLPAPAETADQQAADPDAGLYAAACASCHYDGATAPRAIRPNLALNSALWLDSPNNFIKVVLRGIGTNEGSGGVMMPGFAQAMSDDDIARLAAYLRRSRTNLAPWPNLNAQVAALRSAGDSE